MTTEELTERQEAIADAIRDYVEARPDQDFNTSQLARTAKCATWEASAVLAWMLTNNYIAPTGRGGAWIRYRARRFGEVVTDWTAAR